MIRTTVITGAASGIGKATAERLRADGQTVIGVDLRDADITADLSTAEGRAALVEQVTARSGGHVDAVIAVAGLVAASPVTVAVNYFGAKATVEGPPPAGPVRGTACRRGLVHRRRPRDRCRAVRAADGRRRTRRTRRGRADRHDAEVQRRKRHLHDLEVRHRPMGPRSRPPPSSGPERASLSMRSRPASSRHR